jgi:predicted sulfurtransferase
LPNKRILNFPFWMISGLFISITVIVTSVAGCSQFDKSSSSISINTSTDTTSNEIASASTPISTDASAITQTTIPGHTISVQDAKNVLDTDATAVFIDVRDQASFDVNHIPGAVLIPITVLQDNLSKIPKDKHIIVYAQCH